LHSGQLRPKCRLRNRVCRISGSRLPPSHRRLLHQSTRSFGPAVVSSLRGCSNYTEGGLRDLWIFWIGPLIGAVLAALCQYPFSPECYERIMASQKKVFMTPAGACVCCDNVPDQFLKHNPYQAMKDSADSYMEREGMDIGEFNPDGSSMPAAKPGSKAKLRPSSDGYRCMKPMCF
ncbi:unnamed protein product, partial [Polarella glacialis]